jgi:DNA repair exonuclease SbcCD ATPase subunit
MTAPIQLQAIHLRNFLSFGNNLTEIDLTYFGSTLIVGENLDANSNNGAGKTTIINAICYALFNKPFDNISLQRLINSTNNSKSTLMEVRLFLKKGDDEYEIYRCRGETFNIQVICNGEDVTLDSVMGNDKFVQEIIGMSYDLFTKIIIFSGNSTPFLMLPVSQQRAQIEELFNITLLTEKAVTLKEKIKQTENDINVQEALIKQQENAVKMYNKQVKEAEERVYRWIADNARQIEALKMSMDDIKDVDMDKERELHESYAANMKEYAAAVSELKLLEKDRTALDKEVNALAKELQHLMEAKCPYCLQEYAGAQEKLTEKEDILEEKIIRLDGLTLKVEEAEDWKVSLDIKGGMIKNSQHFSSMEQALKVAATAASAAQRIRDLEVAENPHVDALESLKKNSVAEISYDELNALKRELDHQQFLLKLLTNKDSFIRRRIINQTIPFLNKRLNSYTKEIGLQHIVKFDDDMSCTVSEYGRELDFGNLSSGEKKRVNLSLSLAFRDVLHHLHSKFNCLFIDEIDASLDGTGVEQIFKLLKQKTRDDGLGMWIISHRPEAIGRFDRNITVRKENGFSQIIEEQA